LSHWTPGVRTPEPLRDRVQFLRGNCCRATLGYRVNFRVAHVAFPEALRGQILTLRVWSEEVIRGTPIAASCNATCRPTHDADHDACTEAEPVRWYEVALADIRSFRWYI